MKAYVGVGGYVCVYYNICQSNTKYQKTIGTNHLNFTVKKKFVLKKNAQVYFLCSVPRRSEIAERQISGGQ